MNPIRSVLRTAGAGVFLCTLGACIDGEPSVVPVVEGGSADRGAELLYGYACGGCHVIPGVSGADGVVGPPLTDWVERQYIAGELWNTPENLIAWIVDPHAIEPGTAMPDVGVSVEEARHMAAYLYTLGDTHPLGPPHPFPESWLDALKPSGGKKKQEKPDKFPQLGPGGW
jgi:cytochrome c